MSRVLSPAALAHLSSHCATTAVCWKVRRNDDEYIFGTGHDKIITVDGDTSDTFAGVYPPKAGISGSDFKYSDDMSPDNAEIEGFYGHNWSVRNIRPADIESGLFDDAGVIVFLVNWKDPNAWQAPIGGGWIGDIRRNAEGRYFAERRGLGQKLTRNFIRTYGVLCDAIFTGKRCKVDPVPITFSVTVSAVTNNRQFTVTDPGVDQTFFEKGKVTFTSGNNTGFSMDVRSVVGGVVTLYMPMYYPIMVGDVLDLRQGCDFLDTTCKNRYDNLLNFRGHGRDVPGQNKVLKVGGQEE